MRENVTPCFKMLHSFTDVQQRAMEGILAGYHDSEIAGRVGVNRITLGRWRAHHPEFRAELNRRREVAWSELRSLDGERPEARNGVKDSGNRVKLRVQLTDSVLLLRAGFFAWSRRLTRWKLATGGSTSFAPTDPVQENAADRAFAPKPLFRGVHECPLCGGSSIAHSNKVGTSSTKAPPGMYNNSATEGLTPSRNEPASSADTNSCQTRHKSEFLRRGESKRSALQQMEKMPVRFKSCSRMPTFLRR